MKPIKAALGYAVGFPIGVFCILGMIVGIICKAFHWGATTGADKALDTITEWVQ
jgi:hypothetical protein